ncbi:polyprenyl synthetase family protein [Candidatus Daviesbacteria bacterium]|nr:polyprenyl synthetase family protein [Candidatus Daviesbacteria bacterium]
MEKEIDRLLKKLRGEAAEISPTLLPLIDKFIESCKGGKRVRGKLVVLGYEIGKSTTDYRLPTTDYSGRRKTEDILKVAASYEIMHAAILAHDDIIDQSPERRGKPSLYKSVGVEQAITLADLGFFLAIKIISESKFADKLKIKALQMFSQTMVETAIGQMLDIAHANPELVAKLKTAKYTVSGPLQLGAILGGAELDLLDQLDQFGTNLGIAFQIRDDVLDGEAKSADKALKYTAVAKKIIPKISNDPKMIKLLERLVDYMVERSK